MRPLPPRTPTAFASWALRFAIFTPLLGLVSVVAARFRLITLESFDLLTWFVLGLAVFALLLTLAALRSLWVHGTKGGRLASLALFLCLLTFMPYGWMAFERSTYPEQTDITTDTSVPPAFAGELSRAMTDLPDDYPALDGQRFQADMQTVVTILEQVVQSNGMDLVSQRGRIGADDVLMFEYSWNSLIVRAPHRALIRLIDEGESTFVDIRSRALHGTHDRGRNERLIRKLQSELDFALIGVTG